MSEPQVTYAREGHVAVLTMNRPEAMNAMSVAMLTDLTAAVRRYAEDDEAWVGVLRGEGRAFCTGGDLKEALELIGDEPSNFYEMPRQGLEAFALVRATPKPLIAAVHGYCMAGGLLLANACDLIVSGESCKFGIPETSVGMPTMGYLDLWKFMGPLRRLALGQVHFRAVRRRRGGDHAGGGSSPYGSNPQTHDAQGSCACRRNHQCSCAGHRRCGGPGLQPDPDQPECGGPCQ